MSLAVSTKTCVWLGGRENGGRRGGVGEGARERHGGMDGKAKGNS